MRMYLPPIRSASRPAEADGRRDPVRDREIAFLEQGKRNQRLRLKVLPDDEQNHESQAAADHLRDGDAVGGDLAPVVALAFDQAEDDAEQAGGRKRNADQVPALPPPGA